MQGEKDVFLALPNVHLIAHRKHFFGSGSRDLSKLSTIVIIDHDCDLSHDFLSIPLTSVKFDTGQARDTIQAYSLSQGCSSPDQPFSDEHDSGSKWTPS